MHYNAKASIGFCVKNSAATVEEATENVIGQERAILISLARALIVVDGYSKDRTLSIIKSARFWLTRQGVVFLLPL
jgi:glycosyltransferase involved in cell wall biosynthesis